MFTIEKNRNKKQHLWPSYTLANDQVTCLVGNLCVFKCDVCLTIFPSWVRLETHLSSRHGRPIFKNFDVHNIVEARYHRCCICTHILLCDKSIIKRHIRKHRHNGVDITYEAYKELSQKTENAGPNLSEEDRDMMHPSIPQYKALVLRKKRELNVKDANRAYKMEIFWSMFPDDNGGNMWGISLCTFDDFWIQAPPKNKLSRPSVIHFSMKSVNLDALKEPNCASRSPLLALGLNGPFLQILHRNRILPKK